jgi:hypothetical protein
MWNLIVFIISQTYIKKFLTFQQFWICAYFFSSFDRCWVFSNFVLFYWIKLQNISGTHAASWWQKLAAVFPSFECSPNGLRTIDIKALKFFCRYFNFSDVKTYSGAFLGGGFCCQCWKLFSHSPMLSTKRVFVLWKTWMPSRVFVGKPTLNVEHRKVQPCKIRLARKNFRRTNTLAYFWSNSGK